MSWSSDDDADLEGRNEELHEVAEQLAQSRPVPRAALRGELRAFLAAVDASGLLANRPRRLWWRVSACALAGAVLLALVAAGVAGSGPFAG
jgi:anti-sigma-K factor RskA